MNMVFPYSQCTSNMESMSIRGMLKQTADQPKTSADTASRPGVATLGAYPAGASSGGLTRRRNCLGATTVTRQAGR
jgi:hypothetical protein